MEGVHEPHLIVRDKGVVVVALGHEDGALYHTDQRPGGRRREGAKIEEGEEARMEEGRGLGGREIEEERNYHVRYCLMLRGLGAGWEAPSLLALWRHPTLLS